MRDLYHNIHTTQPLNPIVSATTKISSTVDLQGFESAMILFCVGLSGDTLSGSVYWTLKLQHSDDDSSYSDVPLADLHAASQTVVMDATSKDRQIYAFGYQGNKRYLKASATPSGTHNNGTPIGVVALKGNASYKPVA